MERDIVIFSLFAYVVQHNVGVYRLFATLCYLAYMVQSCKTITDQCLVLFWPNSNSYLDLCSWYFTRQTPPEVTAQVVTELLRTCKFYRIITFVSGHWIYASRFHSIVTLFISCYQCIIIEYCVEDMAYSWLSEYWFCQLQHSALE